MYNFFTGATFFRRQMVLLEYFSQHITGVREIANKCFHQCFIDLYQSLFNASKNVNYCSDTITLLF